MKFSMLAVAATFLAAGVEGFSAAPTRNFAVRKVSSFMPYHLWNIFIERDSRHVH